MGLPWLQVDRGVLAKAGPLAALLRVDEDVALGKLVRLWDFMLAAAAPGEPPTGVLHADTAPELIAGAMRWTGDVAVLMRALGLLGFVQLGEGTTRIRGARRYLSIWKKNGGPPDSGRKPAWNRSDGGRKSNGSRADAGGKPAGSRPQEGEGEGDGDVEKEDSTGGGGDLPLGQGKRPPRPPPPPEILKAGRGFFAEVSDARLKAGLALEKRPADYDSWFATVHRELGGDMTRLRAAYLEGFAQDPYWEPKRFPLTAFMSQVRDYVPRRAVAS